MSSLYNRYKNDTDAEAKVGIDLKFGDSTISVLRAGGANVKYQTELNKMIQPVRRDLREGRLSVQEFSTIQMRAMARTVVLSWDNVTDENDQPMTFNEDNFVKVMTDLPDLWEAFLENVTNAANYRKEDIANQGTDLGN